MTGHQNSRQNCTIKSELVKACFKPFVWSRVCVDPSECCCSVAESRRKRRASGWWNTGAENAASSVLAAYGKSQETNSLGLFKNYIYLFCVQIRVHRGTHVEVRGQLLGVLSILTHCIVRLNGTQVSGVAASVFAHCTILPAYSGCF